MRLRDVGDAGPAQRRDHRLGDQVAAQVDVRQVEAGGVAAHEAHQVGRDELAERPRTGQRPGAEQPGAHRRAAEHDLPDAVPARGEGDLVAAAGQLGALLAGDADRPAERAAAADQGDDVQDPHRDALVIPAADSAPAPAPSLPVLRNSRSACICSPDSECATPNTPASANPCPCRWLMISPARGWPS